jgi:phage tail-like protein
MGLRDSLIKSTPKAVDDFSVEPLKDISEFPIVTYQFAIKIDGGSDPVALFQKISGMTVTRGIDELTEGGFNEYTMEFPREFGYNHIIFESGLSSSDFFYKWMMYGKEQGFALGKNFVLEQRFANKPSSEVKSWAFDGAFPVRWSISDLDVTNSNSIVIETLELSFNTFELE